MPQLANNSTEDLSDHFSKPFGLITCKSFQSRGSLKTDVKLGDIKILQKIQTTVKHATNSQFFFLPTIHFFKFFSSVQVINSLISPHSLTQKRPVCLQHPYFDPILSMPVALSSPFSRGTPGACSSRFPAGSLHCPEAVELSLPEQDC